LIAWTEEYIFFKSVTIYFGFI